MKKITSKRQISSFQVKFYFLSLISPELNYFAGKLKPPILPFMPLLMKGISLLYSLKKKTLPCMTVVREQYGQSRKFS